MLMFNKRGSCKELREELRELWPDAEAARKFIVSNEIISWMYVHESLLLYELAIQYNFKGSDILEIGTAFGGSTAIIASAAPLANIVTVDPNVARSRKALNSLRHWNNITAVNRKSWEYLSTYTGPSLNLIIVDGDHVQGPWEDVLWWNWLRNSGLILFHDYSTISLPNIYKCVNMLGNILERQLDVYIGTPSRAFVGYYFEANSPKIALVEGSALSITTNI